MNDEIKTSVYFCVKDELAHVCVIGGGDTLEWGGWRGGELAVMAGILLKPVFLLQEENLALVL